jgi:dihydroxy-acid dehydratase
VSEPTPHHPKPRSSEVTDGMERAPARAMLRAVGMTDEDFAKPQIAVASSWNEVTPCNLPLDRLAKRAKEGVRAAGGYPMEFTTIAGLRRHLDGPRGDARVPGVPRGDRRLVELMVHAERLDGMVLLAGCDKSLPGMLMAAARMDLASCFLYGGTILPGRLGDKDLTILDAFEGVGACAIGRISREELDEIERHACPTEGSCAGMYTANTMAAAAGGARYGADRFGLAARGRPPP